MLSHIIFINFKSPYITSNSPESAKIIEKRVSFSPDPKSTPDAENIIRTKPIMIFLIVPFNPVLGVSEGVFIIVFL